MLYSTTNLTKYIPYFKENKMCHFFLKKTWVLCKVENKKKNKLPLYCVRVMDDKKILPQPPHSMHVNL